LHHLDDELGGAAKVFAIGGDVGNRQQAGELIDDWPFMCAAIIANGRLSEAESAASKDD
jgi:hypothetical protein